MLKYETNGKIKTEVVDFRPKMYNYFTVVNDDGGTKTCKKL